MTWPQYEGSVRLSVYPTMPVENTISPAIGVFEPNEKAGNFEPSSKTSVARGSPSAFVAEIACFWRLAFDRGVAVAKILAAGRRSSRCILLEAIINHWHATPTRSLKNAPVVRQILSSCPTCSKLRYYDTYLATGCTGRVLYLVLYLYLYNRCVSVRMII